MKQSRVYVVTGATSGLGLATVRHLAKDRDTHFIVGARNFARAGTLKKAVPTDQLTLLSLNVADLSSVRGFCDQVIKTIGTHRLSGLCLNAGLQFSRGDLRSPDGIELTFATNHLGHFLLYENLAAHLAANARVVTIGSGTQNPEVTGASRFGYCDGVYTSAAELAKSAPDTNLPQLQQGKDAYAASKLTNIMWVKAMARQDTQTIFLSLHPGAMPGTGLARDGSLLTRIIWNSVMRLAVPFIHGSTPKRSGAVLARLLTDHPAPSGSYISFENDTGPAHPMTENHERQDELLKTSRALVQL